MKYMKYLALLGVLMVPLAFSQAQVRVGVGIGFGPGYVAGPPVCPYGYFDYYPYACAPYGYYGGSWFVDGVFIGAGPWYHSYYGRPFYGRGYYGGGRFFDRDGRRDFDRRGPVTTFRGDGGRGGFRGDGGFHGGGGTSIGHGGGGSFHGSRGGESRGGGRR